MQKLTMKSTLTLARITQKSKYLILFALILIIQTGLLSDNVLAQFSILSNEKLVNNITAGTQQGFDYSNRTIAVQPLGGYIVTWIDKNGADGSADGVFVRLFDAAGAPIGNQIQVNTRTGNNQTSPSISVSPDGSFLVSWEGPGDATDAYGQRFTKFGEKIGSEFLLTTTISGGQDHAEVAYFPDGSFVACFQDGTQSVLQKFDRFNRTIGQEVRLNSGGAINVDGICPMPDGRLLIYWMDTEVYGQFLSSDLVLQGSRVQLNNIVAGTQANPYARVDDEGNIVAVWESVTDIAARRFNSSLIPLGPEFVPTTNLTNTQAFPIVIVDKSGRFVIAWSDNNNRDGGGAAGAESGTSVWFREFDTNGNAIGIENQVNQTNTGIQRKPVGDINQSGKFVIAWEGNGPGDALGIFSRDYQLSQTGTTSITAVPSSVTSSDIITVTMTLAGAVLNNVQPNAPTVAGTNGVSAILISGPTPSTGNSPGVYTWTYKATTIDKSGTLTFGSNAHTNAGNIFPMAISNAVSVTPAIFLSDLTAPNIIGDANKPGVEGPNVFSIGAKITNGGLTELTDVVVYLGDGTTPGTFPTTTMTLAQTSNTYQGSFSLSPLSGIDDCTRPLLKLAPAKRVIAGGIDFNGDLVVNGADNGILSNGRVVIGGKVDVNNSNSIDAADDYQQPPGKFTGWREPAVIDGLVDLNGDNIINALDEGTYGGETRNLYWQVVYTQVDLSGQPTFGNAADLNDDLRYRWKVWTIANDGGKIRNDELDEFAKVRPEINASANKLLPAGAYITASPPRIVAGTIDINADGDITAADDGSYFGKNVIDGSIDMNGDNIISAADDGNLSGFNVIDGKIDIDNSGTITIADNGVLVQPGQTFSVTVHNADFGNIGAGFDENRDGFSDYDVWYQPIGKSTFPGNSYRLIDIQADVTGSGGTPFPTTRYDNEPYLSQLVGVSSGSFRATYTYTFQVVGDQDGSLSLYQQAGSGENNEKYNGDFDAPELNINIFTGLPALTLTKTSDKDIMKVCDDVTWTMTYQNTSTTTAGDPGTGNGVIVEDIIPATLLYVAGSATSTSYPTIIQYSINNGATWTFTEPVPASAVNRIRWNIEVPVPANGIGTVSFKTIMNNCQPHNDILTNNSAIKLGTGADLATASKAVTVQNLVPVLTTPAVNRTIIGCSTAAITGPVFSTTPAVSSEAEFENGINQGVVSDDCGITEVTYSDVAVGTCPIVVTRTWVIKDVCGNTVNSIQTITINNTSAITGTLFYDTNGLSDGEVNGTGTNGGGLNAVLLTSPGNVVVSVSTISQSGAFSFGSLCSGNYNIYLTTASPAINSVIPDPVTASLNPGWVSTGEFEGTGPGNDLTPNSVLLGVTVTCGSLTNTLFGIKNNCDDCITYRTTKNGVWNDVTVWEVQSCIDQSWSAAANIPPQRSLVRILHVINQNVDFTVEQCPLILETNGVSKLIIEPDITLGFNGGNDGNAYFNSRPVIVRSTEVGTGAIGKMLSNSKTSGDDNVTLERFIPGSKRRWNLITVGVTSPTATFRDGWGGGSRIRVDSSQNAHDGLPFGSPPVPKPNNVPFPIAGDYVAGDGTIITGHSHTDPLVANGQGFDWWPELIIRKGSKFWTTKTNGTKQQITAANLVTTPSSIRPYRPGGFTEFGPVRGTAWISQSSLNTDYRGFGVSIANTNLDSAEQGYMLYTRGDRQVLENWYNSTTLRPTGQIKKLEVSVPISPDPGLTPFGNPYPAPINFEKLMGVGTNASVIKNLFYYWDSNLPGTQGNGAWRTVTQIGANDWIAAPTPTDPVIPIVPSITEKNVQFISSSQAVLLEGLTGTTQNIIVTEDVKVDIKTVDIIPFDEPGNSSKPGILFTNINTRNNTNELSLMDGVAVLVRHGYNPETNDASDIKKIYSFTDANTSISLAREGQRLGIEAYPEPESEAIFYLHTKGLEKGNYALTFGVRDLYKDGREIFIKDNFLRTEKPVSAIKISQYDFEVTDDTLSLQPNRFEILFKQSELLPVTFTSINAIEQQKNIKVTWNIATEDNMSHYEVEYSRNGTEFAKAVKVNAKNISPASYDWLHIQPGAGTHFYRIRAINLEGRSLTTRVVKVTIGAANPVFQVFPTVVTTGNRQVTVQMTSMEKGLYNLQISDISGRVIQSGKIEHNGGSASLLLQLPPALSAGKYNIRLTGASGKFIEPIVKD